MKNLKRMRIRQEERNKKPPQPRIELGSPAWQAGIIATILLRISVIHANSFLKLVIYQQHPPFFFPFTFSAPKAKLCVRSGLSYLAATAFANSLNTSSTPVPVLAEVNINLIFFCFAQAFIFYSEMEFPKSTLLPTRKITEVSALDLHS